MIERDNLVAALDAYIQAHLEKYIQVKQPESAPVTPAPATTTDRYSTKYDDASRKEALEIMRMNGLSTEGLSDGLNDAHISFTMSAITEMAAQFPNIYKTKKDIVDSTRVEAKRSDVVAALRRNGIDPAGMDNQQLADAMHTLDPSIKKYTVVD